MPGISEIGAAKVEVENYQCSIKKITVSTKWKAPNSDLSETVTATVFDGKSTEEGKTIYVIASPEGKEVTIKTERDEGKCRRDAHKKYTRSWDDYKVEGKQNDSTPGVSSRLPISPYKLIKDPQKKEEKIKNEEKVTIKCFEIGGVLEALKYWKLPITLDQNCITKTKCFSCKEGQILYQIIAYPDISFKLELSMGTKEAAKKKNGRSHFERKTNSIKYVPERTVALIKEAPGVEVKFEPPVVTASTTYNGENDEVEVELNFDKEEELYHFHYTHDSNEIEIGSEFVQDFSGTLKKIEDLCKLIVKLCDVEKNFEELKKKLVKNYKPYKLQLTPPSVSLSVEGKYKTSKDLTRIGKLYDIAFVSEPLVSLSLKIDLLFLIISGLTAGTGGGVYLMLKNLDDVIGKLLNSDYKKKYKEIKPFECDIYFDLVFTGTINGNVHWLIDTTEVSDEVSDTGALEGVLKVDLKAGAKVSVNYFYLVTAEGEASVSGSSGIKFSAQFNNRVAQGEGLAMIIDTIFLGLKVKYCIKGKIGFYKTVSAGGSLVDGEKMLAEKKRIDRFSTKMVFFKDNSVGAGT